MIDSLLSRFHEVEEERDDIMHRYHLLASEMVYEGNSVQHWQQKAMAYKECAGVIYDLKQLTGAETPEEVVKVVGELLVHPGRIKEHARYVGHTNPDESITAQILADVPSTNLTQFKINCQTEVLENLSNDLVLNSENARENGYSVEADVMQGAADYVLGKIDVYANAARQNNVCQRQGPPFIFDRFRNGVKMAEGVRIERSNNLEDATRKAAAIAASEYPKGDVLVFSGHTTEGGM